MDPYIVSLAYTVLYAFMDGHASFDLLLEYI